MLKSHLVFLPLKLNYSKVSTNMSFVVSARKYRPLKFDDVVGQSHVAQTLKNALRNDKLAHAFLFCGPRGVGKTTCARILAKVLNCQNPADNFEPCNACNSCDSFNKNASFNIIELDAASNNSVDHIRLLNEQVRFRPQEGKYKVFIIDEVHMLSSAAFNAFLKTLEEPPPYAVFILATTEKHKIIPTILSRCQIFDFKRIQIPEIVGQLDYICKQEGLNAESDALHLIAQKADGALRDALSVFDRIVSADKEVTYQSVISNLNILDYEYFFKATNAIFSENLPEVMNLFDEILQNGFEADTFIIGLGSHFRDLLVCKDESTLQLLEGSESLKEKYFTQSKLVPSEALLSGLNLINDCDINYRLARNKRLHTEMTLMKLVFLNRVLNIEDVEVLSGSESTSNMEKKKPELKKSPISTESSSPGSAEFQSESDNNDQTKDAEVESTDQAVANSDTDSINPSADSTLKKEVVQLKGLDALMAEVVSEEDDGEEALNKQVDLDALLHAWSQYVETKENHAKSILENSKISLNENIITVTVGSELGKNTVIQEKDMMSFLRSALNSTDLIRVVEVDESIIPEVKIKRPPKALTAKEKFQQMQEQNPVIHTMFKRFDLKLEED